MEEEEMVTEHVTTLEENVMNMKHTLVSSIKFYKYLLNFILNIGVLVDVSFKIVNHNALIITAGALNWIHVISLKRMSKVSDFGSLNNIEATNDLKIQVSNETHAKKSKKQY